MNINFQDIIPHSFKDNSRVWIYQSDRAFTKQEMLQIEGHMQKFIKEWKSHGTPVMGYAHLFFERFIVLMADKMSTTTDSFSTYSAVRFIKNIERDFEVNLFDRLMLAFIIQERIQLLPLSGLNLSIEKDLISPDTLYFNNTILTKNELLHNWIIPVKESWLSGRVLGPQETEAE